MSLKSGTEVVANLHYDNDFKQTCKIYGVLVEPKNEYDSRLACFKPHNLEDLRVINKSYLIELINSKGYFTIGTAEVSASVPTCIVSKYRY